MSTQSEPQLDGSGTMDLPLFAEAAEREGDEPAEASEARPYPWERWTGVGWTHLVHARWPRLCRAAQYVGRLTVAEVAITARDYVRARDTLRQPEQPLAGEEGRLGYTTHHHARMMLREGGPEAVEHIGPEHLLRTAAAYRRETRRTPRRTARDREEAEAGRSPRWDAADGRPA